MLGWRDGWEVGRLEGCPDGCPDGCPTILLFSFFHLMGKIMNNRKDERIIFNFNFQRIKSDCRFDSTPKQMNMHIRCRKMCVNYPYQ